MLDAVVKRTVDLLGASTALVLSAPVLAIVAAAIKLDSPGAFLYRQTRVGRHGRPIQTLKLRTMHHAPSGAGSHITAQGDRRVTRVGRILRKTKLDELPQLWNVVRGDMSLVGPRPEVPRYVAEYRPEWHPLLEVRPGLTDLASVTFRDEESLLAAARDHERAYREVIMPMKLALALEGVQRTSLAQDLAILVRTVASVLGKQSAAQAEILAEARRRIEQLNRTCGDS